MTKYIAERVTGLASYNLPAPLVREIGRIIVSWAYFEYCVQEMNWQALGISEAAGRIAMREPRVTDRLEMLSSLIELRDGTWDIELYKSILARSRILAAKRDLLAHGIWGYVKHLNEWHVQLARGSWPNNRSDLIKGSKKVTPESVPMDSAKLRQATTEIEALSADLKKLRLSAVSG
jgi:hypothetical protein